MSQLFLGVDGGQSSTTALISDERGKVLGTGVDGPCNHVTGNEAEIKFRRVVGGCIAGACREAGVDVTSIIFRAACLGFSGGAADKERLVRELVHSENIQVTHDAEIAHAGALAGEPGIIVVSGTGSIAWGKNGGGQIARAGGWGYVFGDEGGAFDLVRRALQYILKNEEGWGSETLLAGKLLDAAGAKSANELMHQFYTADWPRSRVARFASLVTETATGGDRVAQAILLEAAGALCAYVAGVHRQLFTGAVPVATIGGTWAARAWRTAFASVLQKTINCPAVEPRATPAEGAAWMARHSVV